VPVLEAFLWGTFAAATLVLGALVVQVHQPDVRTLGLVMGFGSGVLLSAVSFELVDEAVSVARGLGSTSMGLFAGALTFYGGDVLIGRMGYRNRKPITPQETSASPLAIVLGAALDGVPESAVLGLTILQNGSVAASMVVAVFISNLPESMAATAGLLHSGWSRRGVLALWTSIALLSGVSAAAGYALLDSASADTNAFVLAFAGGAILTMLSTSMIPEGYEHAGRTVGLATTLGFVVAFAINWLEG
jgi:ZIP family zinc transporter